MLPLLSDQYHCSQSYTPISVRNLLPSDKPVSLIPAKIRPVLAYKTLIAEVGIIMRKSRSDCGGIRLDDE